MFTKPSVKVGRSITHYPFTLASYHICRKLSKDTMSLKPVQNGDAKQIEI